MLDPILEAGIRKWRKVPRYFLALLEGLQFRNATLEPMRQLDAMEWNELLSFSDRAHLTLLLSQLPSDVLPGWVASRVQKNVFDNTKRIEGIKTLYQEAEYALRRVNAEHLVIKGFTQYPDYVKSPNLRMQSDIDIFCPSNTILPARDALLKLGYEPKLNPKYSAVDHFPPMVRTRGWQWRGNAFDPEMPPAIELHYCLWNEQAASFGIPELDAFWYRRVTRDIGGFAFPALDPVDQIGFCSLHVLRGLMRFDWIVYHVYEVAYFLNTHAHDRRLWKSWQQSHSDGLRSLEAISFCMARMWFGCNVAVEAEKQILALPLHIQQWFHCFCSSPLEAMFMPSRDGVWLHIALLESAGTKLSVLRKGLLPVGIPSMAVAESGFRVDRKAPQISSRYRPVSYATYAFQRADYFAHVFVHGVSSGIRCWRSHRKFGAPFWKFFAASCFWSLGLSIFFLLFNLFLVNHGFSEKLIGGLTTTMAAGSMAAPLPVGRLATRFGLRRILLCGFFLALCIFPLRVLLLAESAQWALAFLAGAALSVWAVCISPSLAQLTTEGNRSFAFSLVFSSGVGLVALGNLIGGNLAVWLQRVPRLATITSPSQAALLIACGIAAIGIFPLSSVKFPEMPRINAPAYGKSRYLIRFLPAIGFWGLAIGCVSPFAAIYFSRHLNMPMPRLGLVFSIAQAFQFLGILFAPALFRKSGRLAGIVYTEVAASIALLGLAMIRGPMAASILYVGYTTAQWMSEPGLYSMLMDNVAVGERSNAAAWNALVLSASQAIAAACAGAALVRFGYAAVLSAAAGLAFVAACSFKLLLHDDLALRSSHDLSPAASPSVAL